MGVGFEDVQQLFGHFLATRVTGMSAVTSEIAALPNQPVPLTLPPRRIATIAVALQSRLTLRLLGENI